MSDLIIEAGKFYKTRGGAKARVYALDGAGDFCVHGAIYECNPKQWHPIAWLSGGKAGTFIQEDLRDLVSIWIEPPVVDWDRLPPGILAVAIDEVGYEYGYLTADIRIGDEEWHCSYPQDYIGSLRLWYHKLPEGTIRFDGDWRDSLAIRPGYEESTSCTKS